MLLSGRKGEKAIEEMRRAGLPESYIFTKERFSTSVKELYESFESAAEARKSRKVRVEPRSKAVLAKL